MQTFTDQSAQPAQPAQPETVKTAKTGPGKNKPPVPALKDEDQENKSPEANKIGGSTDSTHNKGARLVQKREPSFVVGFSRQRQAQCLERSKRSHELQLRALLVRTLQKENALLLKYKQWITFNR
jgi:hypothetical protein